LTMLASGAVRQPPAKVNGSLGIITKKSYATPDTTSKTTLSSPTGLGLRKFIYVLLYSLVIAGGRRCMREETSSKVGQ
jgi:hypothetical protein